MTVDKYNNNNDSNYYYYYLFFLINCDFEFLLSFLLL